MCVTTNSKMTIHESQYDNIMQSINQTTTELTEPRKINNGPNEEQHEITVEPSIERARALFFGCQVFLK